MEEWPPPGLDCADGSHTKLERPPSDAPGLDFADGSVAKWEQLPASAPRDAPRYACCVCAHPSERPQWEQLVVPSPVLYMQRRPSSTEPAYPDEVQPMHSAPGTPEAGGLDPCSRELQAAMGDHPDDHWSHNGQDPFPALGSERARTPQEGAC